MFPSSFPFSLKCVSTATCYEPGSDGLLSVLLYTVAPSCLSSTICTARIYPV